MSIIIKTQPFTWHYNQNSTLYFYENQYTLYTVHLKYYFPISKINPNSVWTPNTRGGSWSIHFQGQEIRKRFSIYFLFLRNLGEQFVFIGKRQKVGIKFIIFWWWPDDKIRTVFTICNSAWLPGLHHLLFTSVIYLYIKRREGCWNYLKMYQERI